MEKVFIIAFVITAYAIFMWWAIRTHRKRVDNIFNEIRARGHWEINTRTFNSKWIPGKWRTPFGNLPEEKCVELEDGSWLFPEEPVVPTTEAQFDEEPKVVVTSEGQTIVTGNLIKSPKVQQFIKEFSPKVEEYIKRDNNTQNRN